MATGNEQARRRRSQRLDEIMRGVRALTDASVRRHRLGRDTPEYAAALETEERLADRIWDLGAVVDADADADPGPKTRATDRPGDGAAPAGPPDRRATR